jgi:Polyketide cyclase / dehydrase and lipid transport
LARRDVEEVAPATRHERAGTMRRMTRIRVSTVIEAAPREVWSALDDVASHVVWMQEARAIRFRTSRRHGVGTTFECDTRVGPLQLTDVMEITSWQPGRRMGVDHQGVVAGRGAFTLRRARRGRTRFTWREQLTFPWWLGGPIGAVIGSEALRAIWRHNLRNLKATVEDRG